MHCDIAGVMMSSSGSGYFTKGMTGVPVRTFVEMAKSQ
jgi:leucyl aminopeptidase